MISEAAAHGTQTDVIWSEWVCNAVPSPRVCADIYLQVAALLPPIESKDPLRVSNLAGSFLQLVTLMSRITPGSVEVEHQK